MGHVPGIERAGHRVARRHVEGGGIGVPLGKEQYAARHGRAYEMKSPLLAPVLEEALFSARPDVPDVPDLPVGVPYRDQQRA